MDELKKIFLAGVGLTSTSVEKAEKLVNEMVEKGRVTVQEGKELQSELTRKATNKPDITYATKQEIAVLELKLDALSQKVDELLNK